MALVRGRKIPNSSYANGIRTSSRSRENNKQLLNQKLTYENCVEIKHNIHNIRDIVNLPKNININIYDLPGLNDGESKDIYFNYIKKNGIRNNIFC